MPKSAIPTSLQSSELPVLAIHTILTLKSFRKHVRVYHRRNRPQSLQPRYPCPRCQERFVSDEAIREHLQLRQACEPRTPQHEPPPDNPEDGITDEVYEVLNIRKADGKINTWESLWLTLFPQDGERIPSSGETCDETKRPIVKLIELIEHIPPTVVEMHEVQSFLDEQLDNLQGLIKAEVNCLFQNAFCLDWDAAVQQTSHRLHYSISEALRSSFEKLEIEIADHNYNSPDHSSRSSMTSFNNPVGSGQVLTQEHDTQPLGLPSNPTHRPPRHIQPRLATREVHSQQDAEAFTFPIHPQVHFEASHEHEQFGPGNMYNFSQQNPVPVQQIHHSQPSLDVPWHIQREPYLEPASHPSQSAGRIPQGQRWSQDSGLGDMGSGPSSTRDLDSSVFKVGMKVGALPTISAQLQQDIGNDSSWNDQLATYPSFRDND